MQFVHEEPREPEIFSDNVPLVPARLFHNFAPRSATAAIGCNMKRTDGLRGRLVGKANVNASLEKPR